MSATFDKQRLFNKNFNILWHSQLVSQFGSQAFSVAMLFWIKQLTESATIMGTLLMVSMLPGVILSPLGGIIADFYSRKKIIIISDLVCGVAVLLFSFLFFFIPEQKEIMLVALFLVSILVGISKTFFTPAILAVIPDIVPSSKIKSSNSIIQATGQLATFIGLGAGGILFRVLGAQLLFLLDGITYVYAAIVQGYLKDTQIVPEKKPDVKERILEMWQSILEGFLYILKDKGIRTTFILAAVLNFLFGPVLVGFPFFVQDVLKVSVDWYGYLIAGFGAGTMFGFLSINVINIKKSYRGYMVAAFYILLAISNYALGYVTSPFIALFIMIICGFFSGYINISIFNQLLVNTSQEMRGRIFGNLMTLSGAILPISLGLSGILLDAIDHKVEYIFKGSGIAMVIVTLVFCFKKEVLSFFEKDEEKEEISVEIETHETAEV